MGKDRRGRECGKGIVQRKDGLYSARYSDKLGKRHQKYFNTVQEARKWITEASKIESILKKGANQVHKTEKFA